MLATRLRRKAARWVPLAAGRLPYAAALAAAEAVVRASTGGRARLWARNSYVTGALVPLVSDLDLTLWLEDEGAFGPARRALSALKRVLPLLGETNVYAAWDVGIFGPLMNRFELGRDPELARRLASLGAAPVGEVERSGPEAAAFLLRMLEGDLAQVTEASELRKPKWDAHLEAVGLEAPAAPTLRQAIGRAAARLSGAGEPEALAASIERFFASRYAGRDLFEPPGVDPGWHYAFPHRLCVDPAVPAARADLLPLARAQLEWEACGLYAQPGLVGVGAHVERLQAHLDRLLSSGAGGGGGPLRSALARLADRQLR